MPFVDYPPGAVKRVNAQITTATTTELVAAVSGKSIQVLGLALHESAATNTTVIIQDDAGTPIELFGGTGATIALSVGGTAGPSSVVLPWNPRGWMQTTAGQALDLVNTGTTPDLTALVIYAEV